MANRTKRIYYGPEGRETSIWWTVKVSDAKKPVSINGGLFHALRGYAGSTIGCGLSNMAVDKANAAAFPHPVFLASFTKNTALIVDKLKANGEPAHAIRYVHSYGRITDRNDNRTLKKLVREDPSIIERPFTLRPPRERKPSGPNSGKTASKDRGERENSRAFIPRGALARAVKAGRISKPVARQLTEVSPRA